ncbi:MAG: hypothetical protein MJK12_17095 [Colwellia sp.]|nr:hypothetical protein [Colwellia sp.]
MNNSLYNNVKLEILASDDITEIFVIDSNLNRIESGVGLLKVEVLPGIYKVRYRSGASQYDEIIEVLSTDKSLLIKGRPVLFNSTAPICDTKTFNLIQSERANRASTVINRNVGNGSQLYIFVRETDGNQPFILPDIEVLTLDGEPLASMNDGELNEESKYAALNIKVEPGTYRVRVNSSDIGDYEIFISTSREWQTQVFFTIDEFWHNKESTRIPSIQNATVLMSRFGSGFNPSSNIVRLNELARIALSKRRNVVTSRMINKLLSDKYLDPILGIIASHIILQRHRPDWNLLNIIVNNLTNLIGEHPDVQAIIIALKKRTNKRVEIIDTPPTYRKSWNVIVKASRRRASLVKQGPLITQISKNLASSGLLLIHKNDSNSQIDEIDQVTIAGSERIFDLLSNMDQKVIDDMFKKQEIFSPLELNLLRVLKASKSSVVFTNEKPGFRRRSLSTVNHISAPSYSIANAVASLAEKIKDN